ncbi:hypothetical protein ACQ86I_07530 [Prescottella equi]
MNTTPTPRSVRLRTMSNSAVTSPRLSTAVGSSMIRKRVSMLRAFAISTI